MRALRRFTRSALLMTAAQWAWQHRDEIKREAKPLLEKGQALVRDLQARRQGEEPAPAAEQAVSPVSLYGDDARAMAG